MGSSVVSGVTRKQLLLVASQNMAAMPADNRGLSSLSPRFYLILVHRVGCMLAGFLLNREPFFRGKDNEDQLVRIALVLGTQRLHDFLRKYGKEALRERLGRDAFRQNFAALS